VSIAQHRALESVLQVLRRHPFCVLFALAVGVRGLYVLTCARHPECMVPLIDAATYDTFARRWVELGLRDSTTAWHAAFYPLFLAAVYGLFSPSVLAAMWVQAGIGGLACCGVALSARRCFGERAMWLAGGMAVGYGPLIFYDAQLMPGGWSFFWSVCVLASLLVPLPRRPWMRGLVHGLLGAGAALIRPELLAGYVVGRLMMAGMTRQWKRPTAVTALVALAVFAALVYPISKMNRPWTGNYAFWPINGGLNLYLANAPGGCETMLTRPGPDYDRIVNLPKQDGLQSAAEQNRYFRNRLLAHLRDHPVDAAAHLLRKAAMLLNGYEVPTDLDLYTARPPVKWAHWMMFPSGAGGFPFSLLVLLAGLGLFRRAHQRLTAVYWVYLVVAGLLVLLMPTARYRLILLPPLFLFAAAGILVLLEGRLRSTLKRPAAMLLVGGLLILQVVPLPLCRLDWDFTAERERMIAQRINDAVRALERLEPIQRRQPEDPQVHYFLGFNAWQLGEADRALRHLEEALRLAPDYAYALLLRAEILVDRQHLAAAKESLQAATRSAPDLEEAYLRLALLNGHTGDFAAAQVAVEKVLAYTEDHPMALHILADLYIQDGQAMQALSVLNKLLERNSDQPDVHASVAEAAWQLRQVSRARHHALEALRLQPGHARAASLLEEMNGNEP
jgi:Flp pilus assembly protein TadD